MIDLKSIKHYSKEFYNMQKTMKTLYEKYYIDDKTSCLVNLNQTTEHFVTWVNQQKNNNDSLKDVVKTYLANTLLNGQFISTILRRMKIPSYYSHLFTDDKIFTNINNISELKKFFLFDNDEYVKIAHDYFCQWIDNFYFTDYISNTTPCNHFTECSIITTHRPALHADFLQNIFIFMANNPSIFTVKDIENFINKFVENLQDRLHHQKLGTYWYEMSILCEMAKYLRYYNLSCENIKNYVENTVYAKDTGNYYGNNQKNYFVEINRNSLQNHLYELNKNKLIHIIKVQDPHFILPNGLFYRKYKISKKKKFTTLKQLKSLFCLQQNLNTEQEQNK